MSKQESDNQQDEELVTEELPDLIEEPLLFDEPSEDQLLHPGHP